MRWAWTFNRWATSARRLWKRWNVAIVGAFATGAAGAATGADGAGACAEATPVRDPAAATLRAARISRLNLFMIFIS
jgi:hypothetical protein